MKTLFLIASIAIAVSAAAQESAPLQLWADQQRLGPVKQAITDTGLVEELRLDLQGRVSSLEVADGFTVTLYDGGGGLHALTLVGPFRVDDLEMLPMLGLRSNWDDAIGSVDVQRTGNDLELPPVVAEARP